MAMPRGNIGWESVSSLFQVEVRRTTKGGNSYFVATDEKGAEFVPNWGGSDSVRAQGHLNRLAAMTTRRKGK
jgi:hypothetical protein